MTFLSSPDETITVVGDNAGVSREQSGKDNSVNGSCNVGQVDKTEANHGQIFNLVDSKFDFNANSGFKLKVLGSSAGFGVLLKLEEIGNPGNNTELAKTTTVGANEWRN